MSPETWRPVRGVRARSTEWKSAWQGRPSCTSRDGGSIVVTLPTIAIKLISRPPMRIQPSSDMTETFHQPPRDDEPRGQMTSFPWKSNHDGLPTGSSCTTGPPCGISRRSSPSCRPTSRTNHRLSRSSHPMTRSCRRTNHRTTRAADLAAPFAAPPSGCRGCPPTTPSCHSSCRHSSHNCHPSYRQMPHHPSRNLNASRPTSPRRLRPTDRTTRPRPNWAHSCR